VYDAGPGRGKTARRASARLGGHQAVAGWSERGKVRKIETSAFRSGQDRALSLEIAGSGGERKNLFLGAKISADAAAGADEKLPHESFSGRRKSVDRGQLLTSGGKTSRSNLFSVNH